MPYKLSILFLFSFLWDTLRALDYYHMHDKSDGPGPGDPILAMAISESNSIIISAHSTVFNIYEKPPPSNYYNLHSSPVVPTGNIISLDVTGDGEFTAIGIDTTAVLIYQVNGLLGVTLVQTLTQATDAVRSIYFSKDQTLLFCGSKDSKARLYFLLGTQYVISAIFADAAATSSITASIISSNNSYLYTADSTGKLRIYKKATNGYQLSQTYSFAAKLNALSVSNDSTTLIGACEDGTIKIYKLAQISQTVINYQDYQTINDTTDPLISISISSNGKIIAASSSTSTIRVYEIGQIGFYALKRSNLTGSLSKVSLDGNFILGSSTQILKIYETCSVIINCQQCSTRVTCTKCLAGFFALADGTCSTCSTNCSSCLNVPTHCTACVEGYFVDPSFQCAPCVTGCKRCTTNAATCSSCYDKFYLSATSCLACQTNCSKCTNSTDCVACASNYYNSSGICLPCVLPCNKCENVTYCTGCIDLYYLESPTRCSLCQSPCVTCTSLYNCLTCASGYYFVGGSSCAPCRQFCLTCSSSSICGTCNSSYLNVYHNGTTCVFCPYNCSACSNPFVCTSCAVGFYQNGLSCPKCNSPCTSCSSASVCTSCTQGYVLFSGSCITCPANCLNCSDNHTCTSCKKSYYLQNFQCSSCSMPGCVYCLSATQCLLCQGGYGLVNSVCISFQTSVDPYAYVKQITITKNQTLNLIITVIVLLAIFSLGFAVYYWIIKPYEEQQEAQGQPRRNEGNQADQQQHNRSEANLVSNTQAVAQPNL